MPKSILKNDHATDLKIRLQTDPTRGYQAIADLDDLLRCGFFDSKDSMMKTKEKKLNLLLVGAGYESLTGKKGIKMHSSFEAYNFAAYLESEGRDYSMTIIDIDPRPIEEMKKRRLLFVPESFLKDREDEYDSSMNFRKKMWQDYLNHTSQKDRIIKKSHPGFSVSPKEALDDILSDGVHVVNIPQSFKKKLATGEIKPVVGDIARAQFDAASDKTGFDFIYCANVMYMLSREDQQKAFINMHSAMARPGCMYILDPFKKDFFKGQSFIDGKKRGWLNAAVLKKEGLSELDFGYCDISTQRMIIVNSRFDRL